MKEFPSPQEIKNRYAMSVAESDFVLKSRAEVEAVLRGSDKRRLIILGPCSIHHQESALRLGEKIAKLQLLVEDKFLLVMRTYFEKSRTLLGWPGFLYDPHLNGTMEVEAGIHESRQLLRELIRIGVPCATEFLAKPSALYLSDLISWGSIGARTSSSPLHRHMASHLPIPMGFKNSVEGLLSPALNGIETAKGSHPLFWVNDAGRASLVKTSGNPMAHLVLRGGTHGPNYEKQHIEEALKKTDFLLVDCAHGNSGKNPDYQAAVFEDVIRQMEAGNQALRGLMIETHHKKGSQSLEVRPIDPDLSVTDPCLDFETVESMIVKAAKMLSIALMGASLLFSCVKTPQLSVTTLKVDQTTLASYQTECFDLELLDPPIGQKLLISWRLKKNGAYRIVGTILYRNYTETSFEIPIRHSVDFAEIVLTQESFNHTKGFLSYKVSLFEGDSLIETREHPLFCDLITFANQFNES